MRDKKALRFDHAGIMTQQRSCTAGHWSQIGSRSGRRTKRDQATYTQSALATGRNGGCQVALVEPRDAMAEGGGVGKLESLNCEDQIILSLSLSNRIRCALRLRRADEKAR